MSSCHVRIPNFEFDQDLIDQALREKRLLSMEIEFTRKCNFRCPYCYVPGTQPPANELTAAEIESVLRQAKDMGALKIIVLGGEPMVYPELFERLTFIHDLGMEIEMFTNGYNITREHAKRLYDLGINVVLKMNTFDPDLQDKLAGVADAHKVIARALKNLEDAGYPDESHVLAVSTIISQVNKDEIPQLWRWLREKDVLPYVEMITPQGRATENDWLAVSSEELKELFDEISRMDREEFGQDWEPQPPLVGNACLRHGFSCLVTSTGDVMPCVGIPIPVGNIRSDSLADILADSEVIADLRNFRETIKGPCASCEKSDQCYGCRGAAYNLTGDYLASDPMCWRNAGKQDHITVLPHSAEDLIPQKGTMRLIDTLQSVGERRATARTTIAPDNPLLDDRGQLDECACLELIAQTTAAMSGFKNNGTPPEGFLVGARHMKMLGPIQAGDTLDISIFKVAKFDSVGIIEGIIERNGHIVATGQLKAWERTGVT
jgi:radical SAM protein with 4Fe4S-binding SPASM domain